jgi:hypothetical protein
MARTTPLPLVTRAAVTLALGFAALGVGEATGLAGSPTELRKYEQPVTAIAAKRIRERII